MRITDSARRAVAQTRRGSGSGSDDVREFLLTLRAKKNHAKESDETDGRTDGRGQPRCRQQREGVRGKMLTGTTIVILKGTVDVALVILLNRLLQSYLV